MVEDQTNRVQDSQASEGEYIDVDADPEVDTLQGELEAICIPDYTGMVEDYQEAIKSTQLLARNVLEKLPQRKWHGANKPIGEHDDEISTLGHKFLVTVEMWVEISMFQQPHPVMSALSKDHYRTEMSIKQGVIAELYDFVPIKFHEMMQNYSPFGKLFIGGCNTHWSSTILCLCNHAIKIFGPTVSVEWFELNADRANIPALQALLKVDPSSTHPYSRLAPILRIILFGPNSVSADRLNRDLNMGGLHTVAQLWGMTSTTPRCIAFSAIMICFLLSPDAHLVKKGTCSHINYLADFHFYKELLVKGRDTTQIKKIFTYFDQAVFSTSASGGKSSEGGDNPNEFNASTVLEDMGYDSESSNFDDNDDEDILSGLNGMNIIYDAPATATAVPGFAAAIPGLAAAAAIPGVAAATTFPGVTATAAAAIPGVATAATFPGVPVTAATAIPGITAAAAVPGITAAAAVPGVAATTATAVLGVAAATTFPGVAATLNSAAFSRAVPAYTPLALTFAHAAIVHDAAAPGLVPAHAAPTFILPHATLIAPVAHVAVSAQTTNVATTPTIYATESVNENSGKVWPHPKKSRRNVEIAYPAHVTRSRDVTGS
ncbi:hypothetical protein EW146_g8424 [Bondarzewia mesenterica]|uniref:Uncharacterized protein n=1 Tax=Bondarzewia mesenterica TaxID=1095465 RepID=A0A4S4LEG7_9AGAM|nr:hypothetical protein EW146_g8424 [Bondarzewia mesenterica]